jgi:hypothetical protein
MGDVEDGEGGCICRNGILHAYFGFSYDIRCLVLANMPSRPPDHFVMLLPSGVDLWK